MLLFHYSCVTRPKGSLISHGLKISALLLTLPLAFAQTEAPHVQIGNLLVKPSAFFESAGVFRSTTTTDDMNTRFGTLPTGEANPQALGTVRHSRVQLKTVYTVNKNWKLSAYLESDFMNRTGNPYRWRQYWGKVEMGKWELLAGRGWSLLRPNRIGIDSETELMNTRVIDAAYHIGLVGNRERHLRLVRHQGTWHFALSYERGRDFVPKVVRDLKRVHLEAMAIKGAGRHLGASTAAVVHVTPKVDIVTQLYRARAAGRDVLNTLPQTAGTFSNINGVEIQPRPGLRIYAYTGLANGAHSTGNHLVREDSIGFSHQFYNNAKYGRTLFSMQFSHLSRHTWTNADGRQTLGMVSIRHTIGE